MESIAKKPKRRNPSRIKIIEKARKEQQKHKGDNGKQTAEGIIKLIYIKYYTK